MQWRWAKQIEEKVAKLEERMSRFWEADAVAWEDWAVVVLRRNKEVPIQGARLAEVKDVREA